MDMIEHLKRQREWSYKTFGPPGGAEGCIKHLLLELEEVQADPSPEEWADVLILAFDGAMRDGFSPEEILAAIAAKQAKNEKRQWPDWRTQPPGEPIEHVKGIHD